MCKTLKSCMYILLQVDFKSTDLISYNSQMHKHFFPMRMIITFRSPYLKEKEEEEKKEIWFVFTSAHSVVFLLTEVLDRYQIFYSVPVIEYEYIMCIQK